MKIYVNVTLDGVRFGKGRVEGTPKLLCFRFFFNKKNICNLFIIYADNIRVRYFMDIVSL